VEKVSLYNNNNSNEKEKEKEKEIGSILFYFSLFYYNFFQILLCRCEYNWAFYKWVYSKP
jgi:hypothetical protein